MGMNPLHALAFSLILCVAAQAQNPESRQAYGSALFHTLVPIAGGYLLHRHSGETGQSIGSVMGAYGFVVGPSMGNYHANDNTRGMAGVVFRTAGTVFAGAGLFHNFYANESRNADPGRQVFLYLGISSALWNLFSIGQSLRDYPIQQRRLKSAPLRPYPESK